MTSIRELIVQEDSLARSILDEDLEELERLCKNGQTNVNYQIPYTFNTPLLLAVSDSSKSLPMVELLVKYGGANIERGNTFHGVTPLLSAACGNSQSIFEVASFLLEHGANVHVSTTNGRTPLINACKNGNLPLVRLLLQQYDANLSVYDEQAKNALMHACTENHYDVVKFLINHSGKQLVNDFKVDTAMWYACAAGNSEIVQLLIDNGGLIEYRQDGTIYSTTPLMEACEWGHIDVVQTLLWNGADVTSRSGRKALKLAQSAGHHTVVELMTKWISRIQYLDNFLREDCCDNDRPTLNAAILPILLSKTGKRHDYVNRIIYQRWNTMN